MWISVELGSQHIHIVVPVALHLFSFGIRPACIVEGYQGVYVMRTLFVSDTYLPHTAGRYQLKRFRKGQVGFCWCLCNCVVPSG